MVLLRGGEGVVVPTYINGAGPFRLLVDTGANTSLLTRESLAQLKPEEYELKSPDNTLEFLGQTLKERAYPKSFRIGKLNISNMHFLLMPEAAFHTISPSFKEEKVDGILGTDYLRNCAVDFDSEKKRFTLYIYGKVTPEERAAAGYRDTGTAEVPLTWSDDLGHYLLDLVFSKKGKKDTVIPLVLDTGSNGTILPQKLMPPYAARLKDKNGAASARSLMGEGAMSAFQVEQVRMGAWALNGVRFWAMEKVPTGADVGILGMDLLKGTRFLVDFPARKLFVMPRIAGAPDTQPEKPEHR